MDTGIQVVLASSRKMEAASRAENMAMAYRDMALLHMPHAKHSGLPIFAVPLMVFATPYPTATAPAHSMMPPTKQPHLRLMAPDPTEVPHELAASLDPIP